MYNQINGHNDGSKKKIKVLVVTGNQKVGVETAYKYKTSKGKDGYNGFLYNAFQMISDKLKDKYEFDVSFTDPADQNYTSWVKATAAGKYDLLIGGFSDTFEREKLVNFTVPLYMNSIAILHEKKNSNFKILMLLILDLLKPVLILLFLGVVFGIILFFIEPKRGQFLDTIKGKKNFKKLVFIRTILTTIAAFFGEMGFLSENTNLSILGIITVILIMIIAYIIIMIAQAEITTLNIRLQRGFGKLDLNRLQDYKFLGFEGNADVEKMKAAGADVTYLKDMSYEEAIKYYLKNSNKFNGGIITVHTTAYPYEINDNNLMISYENLGLIPACWVVSKKYPELLDDLDKNILLLREREIFGPLCLKYIKYKNACFI